MIPVLMLTRNRLEYTKKALKSLMSCRGILPYVIDDHSTDGTVEWLRGMTERKPIMFFNKKNKGIAYCMNAFLNFTISYDVVGKVDCDTLISVDWALKMKPYLEYADMIQSKHHIIPATDPGGWDGFTRDMVHKNGLIYNTYIGGSGILFKRQKVDFIPETKWKLGGWREFQRLHPELKKAFVPSVEIKLLDEHGYSDYPEYYHETRRQ
jgi:glycosyltransferase involved in cell wall biosynthesis